VVTFAMERNYIEKIKKDISSINGVSLELIDE